MLKSHILLSALALAGCNAASNQSVQSGALVTLTAQQKAEITETVTRQAMDPRSAVLGPMFARQSPTGPIAVCGTVNGKDRSGSYVGSRWYQVAVTGTKVQVTAFASDDKESQAMQADCGRFGLT